MGHNRGSAFSLDPEHSGRIRPGDTGDTLVALGCQGGRAQAWILAQVTGAIATTDDPVALLGRPRWVIGSRDLGLDGPGIRLEPGSPEEAASAAVALGLQARHWTGLEDYAGHVQAARLRAGVLDAASDPRADRRAAVL